MKRILYIILMGLLLTTALMAYPIDGYDETGIRRLYRRWLIATKQMQGSLPVKGGQKSVNDIHLTLINRTDTLYWGQDKTLQARIEGLFNKEEKNYAIAVLDISDPNHMRYAQINDDVLFSPGSVGKLVVAAGLFSELKRLYPKEEDRKHWLKTHMITADDWVISDHHSVPFFDIKTHEFFSRVIQVGDTFSLFEWIDHMLSASSNSGGTMVWKEAILMRAFGENYPPTKEEAHTFFSKTPKAELTKISLEVVNEPLRKIGITEKDWQLGSMFTHTGKKYVPGVKSYANSQALLRYMIALEKGELIDPWSSLTIKKLLYTTTKRIRYASSPVLNNAMVFYKSGSQYQCKPEEGYSCGKYMGNSQNFMNSVAIIEHDNGTKYAVALMSNVLKKNSSEDHARLGGQIDAIIRSKP